MTLEYIENPVIKVINKNKRKITELMESGEFNKWIIICTSEAKTAKDRSSLQVRKANFRQQYKEYTQVEWDLHEGESNYSIIARKVQA
jgi:hypothetical protein